MKKARTQRTKSNGDTRPEYDLSKTKGIRGKYHKAMKNGYTVNIHMEDGTVQTTHYKPIPGAIALDNDVRKYFQTSESVNSALRALIALVPKKPAAPKPARTKRKKVA